MGLYDIAVGDGHQRERGALLLQLLGGPAVARFRDAWVEKGDDGPVIAIYTRQGGGNRRCSCAEAADGEPGQPGSAAFAAAHVPENCYAACNQALARHPLYITDRDDEFDQTYATFYFRVPDEVREVLAEVAGEPVDTDARWAAALERIQAGAMRPAETALADQLGAFLGDPSPDSPKVMEI